MQLKFHFKLNHFDKARSLLGSNKDIKSAKSICIRISRNFRKLFNFSRLHFSLPFIDFVLARTFYFLIRFSKKVVNFITFQLCSVEGNIKYRQYVAISLEAYSNAINLEVLLVPFTASGGRAKESPWRRNDTVASAKSIPRPEPCFKVFWFILCGMKRQTQ